MKVLLTGATGFIGRSLARRIEAEPHLQLTAAMRAPHNNLEVAKRCVVSELSAATDWSSAVAGQQVVVHTAARVHVMNDTAADPLIGYRALNVDGTLNLARQAVLAGVKRFVFVSSVKVNGECTQIGKPYTANAVPAPEDAYGISKMEAEVGLKLLAQKTGLDVVIIRPPLVYGEGVKGNFSSMLCWLQSGAPLPLGSVTENRRSLVAIDNLVDLLVTCIDHPAAANETFLVSDDEDLSTADLLRRLSLAMEKPTRLMPIPPVLLRAAAIVLGKGDMVQRLLGSLQVDISHTRQTLGWVPPISVDEGLRRTVDSLDK